LDDAIQTALANSEVIRVLAGVGAVASGSTIYDPAITNTGIDEARGAFDPSIQVDNSFNRRHEPALDPSGRIVGDPSHDHLLSMGLTKKIVTGGTAAFRVNSNTSRIATDEDLALNPQSRSSIEYSFAQPLLQGGGARANVAPIVIARIDTERSFFQMKDSVQRSVLGVIEAYWALVFARTDLWVRRQQVVQGEYALNLAQTRAETGIIRKSEVSQARSALQNFRASEITARAGVLQREDALRNILGLPPSDGTSLVPDTPPLTEWLETDWDRLVQLAERYRPDIIELKLILEADQQQMILARNQALPRVDAVALYRWNGLAGRTPDRDVIIAGPGEFREWQFGVNFSVPLGLRQDRAALRRQELVILRDRANLDQGLHQAIHQLAIAYRNLAQFHMEYKSLREARAAALVNLEFQRADFDAGRTIFLNVLQAITNWGNAVSAEAQSLSEYNLELASMELQTGTILESHGIRFAEERYGSIGPLGPLAGLPCYPRAMRPCPNQDRYEKTSEPAENAFNLEDPLAPGRERSSQTPSPSPSSPRSAPSAEQPYGSPAAGLRQPETIFTPKPQRPRPR
jgi:outer membrane protein TolC